MADVSTQVKLTVCVCVFLYFSDEGPKRNTGCQQHLSWRQQGAPREVNSLSLSVIKVSCSACWVREDSWGHTGCKVLKEGWIHTAVEVHTCTAAKWCHTNNSMKYYDYNDCVSLSPGGSTPIQSSSHPVWATQWPNNPQVARTTMGGGGWNSHKPS